MVLLTKLFSARFHKNNLEKVLKVIQEFYVRNSILAYLLIMELTYRGQFKYFSVKVCTVNCTLYGKCTHYCKICTYAN